MKGKIKVERLFVRRYPRETVDIKKSSDSQQPRRIHSLTHLYGYSKPFKRRTCRGQCPSQCTCTLSLRFLILLILPQARRVSMGILIDIGMWNCGQDQTGDTRTTNYIPDHGAKAHWTISPFHTYTHTSTHPGTRHVRTRQSSGDDRCLTGRNCWCGRARCCTLRRGHSGRRRSWGFFLGARGRGGCRGTNCCRRRVTWAGKRCGWRRARRGVRG